MSDSHLNTSSNKVPFLPPIGVTDFLVLFGIYGLLASQLVQFADDPGLGWHLKTGEWIWNHLSIPRLDPFLAGPVARPWVSDQWLSDLILWGLYAWGSWPLLYLGLSIIYIATFLVLLAEGLRRITGMYVAATLAMLIAFKAGEIHFVARPVVFSFLLFSIVYVWSGCLVRDLRAGVVIGAMRAKLAGLGFVALFAIWANMHGAFLLGLMYLGAVVFGLCADKIFQQSPGISALPWKSIATLALVVLLSALATLINPYGIELHLSALELGRSSYFMRYHEEWLSPDFRELIGGLFEFVLLFLMAALFLSDRLRKELSFSEFIPTLLFSHLALQAVRVVPFFAIVAAVPLTKAIALVGSGVWVESNKVLCGVVERLRFIERVERNSLRGLALVSALLVLLVGYFVADHRVLGFEGEYGFRASRYPIAAVEVLRDLVGTDDSLVVAAPAEWGGYLTFAGWPKLRAIIDDRNALLGEDHYRNFDAVMSPAKDWLGFVNTFGATHLMLPIHSPLAVDLKREGQLYVVHEDPLAIIFDLRSESL